MELFETIGWCAGALFVLAALTQLYYYLFVFSKLAGYKPAGNQASHLPPVSVVICAKNESRNLKEFLPTILEQDYPDFEVIVVNNCSWDATGKVLEHFESLYPRLKVVTLVEDEKYPKGKKFGLTLGIKAAHNEVLLFTDADCIPNSPHWIRRMVGRYQANTEIVLGYSPYQRYKSLLNYLIRFETYYTALQYFSYALKGQAYMGVGRNLSYTKTLFFKHKGFASHNHIISGDDDLFVNEAASPSNVRIEIHPESFMFSKPKLTLGEYFKQKTRHLNTGKYYNPAHKIMLGLLNASHILFYLMMALVLVFCWHHAEYVLGIFVLRFLVQAVIFWITSRKLGHRGLVYFFPLFDVYYVFYYLLTGLRALFYKQRAWMY